MTIAADALMDRLYRRQRHVYDATRKYYLLGRDRTIAGLRPRDGDMMLELACGTGRNLIAAARRYPRARLFGLDLSREMLATAAARIADRGLATRVRVAQADATAFDPRRLFGQPKFDRILISYSLSMIPVWDDALAAAADHLAPGGELHIVDFGRQDRLPAWFRAALWRWLALFHVAPRDDLDAALAAVAMATGGTIHCERPYRGYAQRLVLRLPRPAG